MRGTEIHKIGGEEDGAAELTGGQVSSPAIALAALPPPLPISIEQTDNFY